MNEVYFWTISGLGDVSEHVCRIIIYNILYSYNELCHSV